MVLPKGSVFRKFFQAAKWSSLVACLVACNVAFGGVVATLQTTSNTGAQTFLNVNNGYQWTFTSSDNIHEIDSLKGSFSLKLGSNTTADAIMKLYDSTNALVGEASLSPGSATQSWTNYDFVLTLSSPYSYPFKLSPDGTAKTYYLVMTSDALNTGSKTWFIKPDALVFVNITGTQTSRGTYNGTGSPSGAPPAVDPVPEPVSLAVWGLACLGFAGARKSMGRKKLPALN